jgi:uncharacterized membrane protein YkgB
MSKNKNKLKKSETPPDNAVKDKQTVITAKRLETVVAVLLGITTLLSAWASWIGHLHGGLQSINFTKSNNMASQGTTDYNLGMQAYLADYMTWNTVNDYYYDLEAAKAEGDKTKTDILNEKISTFKKQNGSEILAEGIKWMEENNEDNPFKMPGMAEKYFESAKGTVNESQELLEEGKRDNTKGDSYHLVNVIYSVVLFLLGIIGVFKNLQSRIMVLGIALASLVFATIYMISIPMPTGFSFLNFFKI